MGILEIGKETSFETNAFIAKEYDRDRTLYIILKGAVEVRKENKLLAKLGAGQFFGEMAFLDYLPTERSADVVATEPTKCLAIPGWSWYNFLRANGDVAVEVMRSMAARLRGANQSFV